LKRPFGDADLRKEDMNKKVLARSPLPGEQGGNNAYAAACGVIVSGIASPSVAPKKN